MKINITHIIGQLGIGGGEKQLYELIVHSDPDKMNHKVIYYEDGNDEEGKKLFNDSGIETYRLNRKKNDPLGFILKIRKKIIETKPDIVHCWLYSANIYGRWAAILAGCRNIVVAYRSCGLPKAGKLRINEWFTGRRVQYLANSRACAAAMSKKLGVRLDKFDVIYNGADLEKLQNAQPITDIRQQFSIDPGRKLVCMVGRLTAAKNYPMLLRTAKRCRQDDLPLHFLIAGHGEKEQELKALAKQLGVEDTVTFLGLRNDVPGLLKSCDYYIYTSLWEGFPNALLEAMAAGLPVITSHFAGADELVENGRNGVIVPIDNDLEAYQTLKKFFESPDYARALGIEASKEAESRFSKEIMSQNYLEYYDSLMGKK